MDTLREKIRKWGIFWGFIYGLVALGFYFTPLMIAFLGLASLSTAVALQTILLQEYRWHFALLGTLLTFETILLYLRAKGVRHLTMADISPHRVYIGSLIIAFVTTYLVLFFLVALILRT